LPSKNENFAKFEIVYLAEVLTYLTGFMRQSKRHLVTNYKNNEFVTRWRLTRKFSLLKLRFSIFFGKFSIFTIFLIFYKKFYF